MSDFSRDIIWGGAFIAGAGLVTLFLFKDPINKILGGVGSAASGVGNLFEAGAEWVNPDTDETGEVPVLGGVPIIGGIANNMFGEFF